jgi:hypothetical protein
VPREGLRHTCPPGGSRARAAGPRRQGRKDICDVLHVAVQSRLLLSAARAHVNARPLFQPLRLHAPGPRTPVYVAAAWGGATAGGAAVDSLQRGVLVRSACTVYIGSSAVDSARLISRLRGAIDSLHLFRLLSCSGRKTKSGQPHAPE